MLCAFVSDRRKKCIFLIKSKIIHVPFVRTTRKFIMPYLSRDNLAVLRAECLIYFDRGLFKIPFCHINFFSRVADVFVLPWHSVLLLFLLVPPPITRSLTHSLFTQVSFSLFFFLSPRESYAFSLHTFIHIYLFYLLFQTHFFELLLSQLCNVNIVLHTYLVYSFSDIPLSTPHERPRLFFRIFCIPNFAYLHFKQLWVGIF